ncbi:MAG TPA: polymorphic toxin-type HINT domain-containing protein [Telluria sp.]|nr:polymorphic toxin-type HINT domain-containing protein [Telluria sp.]
MLTGHVRRSVPQQTFLYFLIFWMSLVPVLSARAQQSTPGNVLGVKTICQPNQCFTNQAVKDQYAKEHNCQFLEDVCTKKPAMDDNKGMQPGDESIWGKATDFVRNSGLVYGYEFVKGIIIGIKDQVTDLMDFVMNLDDVMGGLYDLGKAFYNDPKGTIQMLGQMLGQEMVDTLTKATQCGAYDLGHVIGGYISPALVLKVATRLTKYGGKVADAVRTIQKDLGCASFVAGTPVWTDQGPVPIETIRKGQLVASRNESSYADRPMPVEEVFGRIAPSYRLLKTETGTISLTDEHPLWVQGKGWTEAREVVTDDVVAGREGDSLILANEAVNQPIRVYNFSVQQTPSYFAGAEGLWVHNAKCKLKTPYRSTRSPSGYKLGASDGGPGAWAPTPRGGTVPVGWEKFETQITGAPKDVEYSVKKVKFDGYDSKTGTLLEVKNYGPDNVLVKGEPDFLVDKAKKEALDQAKRQRGAAGPGKPIEWHVSNEKAAEELRKVFAADPDLVRDGVPKVIYTPDIVN